jgi:hypothetical protein
VRTSNNAAKAKSPEVLNVPCKARQNQKATSKREKQTGDLFQDFANLFQLRAIEEICNSHSELVKSYKAKIENLKIQSQKLAEERKQIIQKEQREFLEAKKQGIKALIDYKLTKQKYKTKLTKVEKQIANDLTQYRSEVERNIAYQRLMEQEKQMQQIAPNLYKHVEKEKVHKGYFRVSNNASKDTQIIANGVNAEIAKHEMNKLTKMQNMANSMLALAEQGKVDKMSNIAAHFEEIAEKLETPFNFGISEIETMDKANFNKQKAINVIRTAQSYIRIAMKTTGYIKGKAMNGLYSA